MNGRRCKAHRKNGEQCKKAPINGGAVCQKHGGGAPQVKAKAAERVLLDQAIIAFGLDRAKDPDRLLAELGCIAYVKTSDLYDADGRMLSVQEIRERAPQADAAIASHEVVTGNVDAADGKRDRLVKVKLHDKARILEMLAKHHQIFEDKVKHEGRIEIGWMK
jgi:hypothetical protein